jgi:PAS domain S-box-containing protein
MKAWLHRHRHRLPWAVLALGLLLDGLAVQMDQPDSVFSTTLHHRGDDIFFVAEVLVSALLALLLRHHIHARDQAERTAQGQTADLQRLALVARSTSNAVVTTDARGTTTWVNAAFERVTGYSLAESVGHSPGRLLQFDGTDKVTITRIRRQLEAGQPFIGDILNRSKDGRVYWTNLDIQPIRDANGQLSGFIGINSDVSERRLTEAALRASQAFLHNTGRIAGVGGWELDLASGQFQWTEQACHILDATPGHQPTAAQCMAFVAPEAQARLQQVLAQGVMAAGAGWDEEVPVVTARGRRLWLRVVAEGEFGDDGLVRIVGALQDITARRALEAKTRRSEALLRGAMDTIDEAFVLFDPDDRLVYCNDRYRHLYQAPGEVLQPGTRFEDIIRQGAERGLYRDAIGQVDAWVAQRLALHQSGHSALNQTLSDGRVLRILERRMPDGHLVGFRTDITDLTRATEAAEQANRAKGEFIATISHELRTPLQSVIGFSELGQAFAQGQAPFEDMFNDIHAGGQRMLTLVNALLDVSKLDGSQGPLSLHRLDVFALAAAVVRELSPLADKRQVRLQLPSPLPGLAARVDAFRLQQVVRNVLSNALRFAPDGSTVEITGMDLGSEGVLLEVRDHGPGIPPGELESIFDAFVQSSRTRDGSGGTGLGLTICRKIMSAHGGIIAATNADGGGACLRLWLPAAAATAATAAPQTTSAPEQAAPCEALP